MILYAKEGACVAPEQPRHEWKHRISLADAVALRERLSAVLQRDRYHPAPHRVRSLYFDTSDNKALREKCDGLSVREKFRLRLYDGDTRYIRLERKSKFNTLCVKETAAVTEAQCRLLLAGDWGWMLAPDVPVLHDLFAKMQYQQLRPRTIIEYTREAFVYAPGNVRVTIDSDIRTGGVSTALFDPDLPLLPVDGTRPVILEVKYDNFLPELVRDLVQVGNRRADAFSKYAAGRIYG